MGDPITIPQWMQRDYKPLKPDKQLKISPLTIISVLVLLAIGIGIWMYVGRTRVYGRVWVSGANGQHGATGVHIYVARPKIKYGVVRSILNGCVEKCRSEYTNRLLKAGALRARRAALISTIKKLKRRQATDRMMIASETPAAPAYAARMEQFAAASAIIRSDSDLTNLSRLYQEKWQKAVAALARARGVIARARLDIARAGQRMASARWRAAAMKAPINTAQARALRWKKRLDGASAVLADKTDCTSLRGAYSLFRKLHRLHVGSMAEFKKCLRIRYRVLTGGDGRFSVSTIAGNFAIVALRSAPHNQAWIIKKHVSGGTYVYLTDTNCCGQGGR